ncbi:MAG: xanthine dehydrogenase family protein molybdopterin-binding subunit [Alphaproteobacteria bacterium]|nr:xanthine dehydrogenase family protein molybdopterin-binding subunit [Alphaproteobacteria bacterium]
MMSETGIGAAVRRREDPRFLKGEGAFTDDLKLPGQCHAAFVRSPFAHARIRGIDAADARQAPGVLAVWTAAELRQRVPNAVPSGVATPPFDMRGVDGRLAVDASQYPLAEGKVRYLGEAVVAVIAESHAQALDAAELIQVDYEELSPIITIEQALDPGAAKIWEDEDSNLSIDWRTGDSEKVAGIFDGAAHVVSRELVNNRLVVAFMEPRGAIASYDRAADQLILRLGCQSAHGMQAGLCHVLDIAPEQLRVMVPDTGGGFGARGVVYSEFPILLAASRELDRPVRWTASRSESMLTDTQARDHVTKAELALDGDGSFLALRIRSDWHHGAYVLSRSIWVTLRYMPPTIGGAYRLAEADIGIRGIFSNTTPQAAYRGVGRAEGNYILESLIDAAAREMKLDPIELRRCNLVQQSDLPWKMAGGGVLTSGAFNDNLDRAMTLNADESGAATVPAHWLRGQGVALYVENDGSTPEEYAEVEALADGTVLVRVGTQDFGMGHQTMYAQIASDRLGVPYDAVEVIFGDTDKVARGMGSHGSRSARMGGGAVVYGAVKMVERGRELAADMLEAAAEDIQYQDGRFRVAGTDRQTGLSDVAAHAEARGERLSGEIDFETAGDVFANGCHVAQVAIDPDTGSVKLLRHVMVCDVGRAINPMIVNGQLHGGAAQGIGQAIFEHVVLDPDSGQTLSGSLLDYCLPRADDLPMFTTELVEIEEADNPLGVKGVGENATTGAPAAVMNAIQDALVRAGGAEVQMPATPERVWRALRSGG